MECELGLLIRQLGDLEDSLQRLEGGVYLGEVPILGDGRRGFAAGFDLDGLYPCEWNGLQHRASSRELYADGQVETEIGAALQAMTEGWGAHPPTHTRSHTLCVRTEHVGPPVWTMWC
jgi:hypothetical protein